MVFSLTEDESNCSYFDCHQQMCDTVIGPVGLTWESECGAGGMPYVTASTSYTYSSASSNVYQEHSSPEQCECHECQDTDPPVPEQHFTEESGLPCPSMVGHFVDEEDYNCEDCTCSVPVDSLLQDVSIFCYNDFFSYVYIG